MTSLFKDWFEYLCNIQEHITAYYDDNSLHHSMDEIEDHIQLAETPDVGEEDKAYDDYIISNIMHAFIDHEGTRLREPGSLVAKAERLLGQVQVEQRTEEWYSQMTDLLTASELGQIFKSPRTRGQLVLSKANREVRGGSGGLAVPSELMSAFDWGIRFEPVAKMIYETLFPGTKIHDVGRLFHPSLARCAASPDGIVLGTHERSGRLIEIKCPVSRDITNASIPDDYYAQMQQQLEVTDLEECDYFEIKIRSRYSKENPLLVQGEARHYGVLWRIEYIEPATADTPEKHMTYYKYGPVGDMSANCIGLPEGHHIVEVIPWEVIKINLTTVKRDRGWWSMAKTKIEEFWRDVEAARRGEFVLPESSRPSKPKKIAATEDEGCLIKL